VLPGGLPGAATAVLPGGLPGAATAVLPGGLPGAATAVLPGGAPGAATAVLPGGAPGAATAVPGGYPVSPANPILPGTPTTPANPRSSIISTGTVADNYYTYIFYSSGVTQINNSYLSPRTGILSGFLNSRTFSGLFTDGLHIGRHVIPYPPQYLYSIQGVALLSSPPSLLSSFPGEK